MDFASLMSAQIAKVDLPPKSPTDVSASEKRKFVKRSEVEAQREATYRKEQENLERARIEKLERKRKLEEEDETRSRERELKRARLAEESRRLREEEEREEERKRRKKLGLPDLPDANKKGETSLAEGEEDIDDGDLVVKLRELGEPITIFGESHKQRLRRYRRLTGMEDTPCAPKLYPGPIPTTLEPVDPAEMKVPGKAPSDAAGRRLVFRQIASYFNMVLRAWETALAGRDEATKSSTSGKAAYGAMVQARENLRPFFRRMEQSDDGTIEDSLLTPICSIVRAAQERRYVDANDGYLRLSIGKAAWPIGVTMVGIHERSAREKLHESDKGHIMSDEVTRKYLQSIKRCLSFIQVRWPPDDHGQLMG